jgi:hypothetical protein
VDESCSDIDMLDENVERLLYYSDDEIAVGIIRVGQGFELHWGDHVVNRWREPYGTLSGALARMALLIYIGEGQWERGFKDADPVTFATVVAELHRSNVPAAFSAVAATFHGDNAE